MFSYMIIAFSAVFWFLRVIIALIYTAGTEFPIVPMNMTFEVILLFITFICIILIAKRKMLGAVIYLIAQCSYFGIDAYKTIERIINGQVQTVDYTTLLISTIAIIIPVLAVLNIGLSTGKKSSGKNRNTDWFYGTTDYERKFDDRADKNQYKF